MTAAGSFTEFMCSARRVGVLFRKGPDLGDATVRVDGVARVVHLYAATPKPVWWAAAYASIGSHTVRVRWRGTKDSTSSGTDVALDGVACIGNGLPQPA